MACFEQVNKSVLQQHDCLAVHDYTTFDRRHRLEDDDHPGIAVMD